MFDETISPLQAARQQFRPKQPSILDDLSALEADTGDKTGAVADEDQVARLFPQTFGQPVVKFCRGPGVAGRPLKVGVVLSGGQAPGGHNVICGLFDALKSLHPESQLIGFRNGPSGIIDNDSMDLSEELIDRYRNTGGFDMIGSGRTKIESSDQFDAALNTAKSADLDGLVVIGGDDSNTNAALLAEYFSARDCKTQVVGVPKTIDGDLKNAQVEISFGHDTACKTYSEIIGNLARDAASAKKYSFFIKLMGRSASHVTLECALQTQPNWTFIGEEVAERKQTLQELTQEITRVVIERSKVGKNYGIYLIPEGIVEFIPEFRELINELNQLLAPSQAHHEQLQGIKDKEEKVQYVLGQLSAGSASCFQALPLDIQIQLLLDRDPHGNVQVSMIETERLFMQMVKAELKRQGFEGKFSSQPFFCGYEGRSCPPSNFDSQYCYALGKAAAVLTHLGLSGYMASVQNLTAPVEQWKVGGVPITMMMNIEERHGEDKPVIQKALVELGGPAFRRFAEKREQWATDDAYLYPGPVQYFGDPTVTDLCTKTLKLEQLEQQETATV